MSEHEGAIPASGELLFIQLASMLHFAAMQSLGKLPNPVTDKIERDLVQAKISIDTLEMLQEKTKGNLSSTEAEFLDKILFELHMNYVDELAAVFRLAQRTHDDSGRSQLDRFALDGQEIGWIMPRIAVHEFTACGIKDTVKDGDKHLVVGIGQDTLIDCAQDQVGPRGDRHRPRRQSPVLRAP